MKQDKTGFSRLSERERALVSLYYAKHNSRLQLNQQWKLYDDILKSTKGRR